MIKRRLFESGSNYADVIDRLNSIKPELEDIILSNARSNEFADVEFDTYNNDDKIEVIGNFVDSITHRSKEAFAFTITGIWDENFVVENQYSDEVIKCDTIEEVIQVLLEEVEDTVYP